MNEFDADHLFTDEDLIADPYPYLAEQRAACPVRVDPSNGLVAVVGYDDALRVYTDPDHYSACNGVLGPFAELPFEPHGDDIAELIEQHRHELPFSDYLATLDPPRHTQVRGLLSRLMSPRRLKENEAFIWELADRQLDEFVETGRCDFFSDYAQVFAMLVIADLLGVPVEDHDLFRTTLAASRSQTEGQPELDLDPLAFLSERFTTYIEGRRSEPQEDVLTRLALAEYPDGSTPEVVDVVHLATFLFAAGQETTSQALTFALRSLAERADIQVRLREDPDLIPAFFEETLRLESPIKSHFRLTRKTTSLGGVDVTAGQGVMVLPGALNRDPSKFDAPDEVRIDRANVREHLAFGHGTHFCPGAPLARVEGLATLTRVLARMDDIRISDTHHGPPGDRRYRYDPTYLFRGLKELQLEFRPVR